MTAHDRPPETREDPADAHARALAELLQADAVRKRDQAASVFGLHPTEHEDTDDSA